MEHPKISSFLGFVWWAVRSGRIGVKVSVKFWVAAYPEYKTSFSWKNAGRKPGKDISRPLGKELVEVPVQQWVRKTKAKQLLM